MFRGGRSEECEEGICENGNEFVKVRIEELGKFLKRLELIKALGETREGGIWLYQVDQPICFPHSDPSPNLPSPSLADLP